MNHIVCHVERRRSIITEKDKKTLFLGENNDEFHNYFANIPYDRETIHV